MRETSFKTAFRTGNPEQASSKLDSTILRARAANESANFDLHNPLIGAFLFCTIGVLL